MIKRIAKITMIIKSVIMAIMVIMKIMVQKTPLTINKKG